MSKVIKSISIVILFLILGFQNLLAISYYLLPAVESVAQYEKYPGTGSMKLEMARGENEHFQMVIPCRVGDQFTIQRENPTAGITFSSRELCMVQEFRDALVPCNGFLTATSDQVTLWFSYFTDRELSPGVYDEKILVSNSEQTITVDVSIRVRSTIIPLRPSIPSEFCVDLTRLPYAASDEQKELWKELLLSYRMDPYFSRIVDPATRKWENCYSPWNWNDKRSKELLKDERYVRFALPNYTLSDDELKVMTQNLQGLGLLERGYYYIWDEPLRIAQYEQIVQESKRIRQIAPQAKILTTMHMGAIDGPHPGSLDAMINYLKDDVQIYPIAEDYFQADEDKIAACRALIQPNEFWTYVCWKPAGTAPNFLMGMTGYQNRAVMWRVWKERGTGFLYWGVNMYKSLDPFEFDRSLAVGDGILVYPGSLFDIKEPVVSVRMELWRDGQEDYELLSQLEHKTDRNLTERIFADIYRTADNYANTPDVIDKFKGKVFDLLENYDSESSSGIIFNGKIEAVDTLQHHLVGPGTEYTYFRMPTIPLEVHVLKMDLHNPNTKIHTFLSNDRIGSTELVSAACQRISTPGYDAYCGINGDFFNIAAHNEKPYGAPRGGAISNGEVMREPRNIDWGFAALDENNIPIIDYMEFAGTVLSTVKGVGSYKFNDVNIPRSDCYSCDMTFYNRYAGGNTRMDENTDIGEKLKTEVFVRLQEGKIWNVNTSVNCEVVRIIKDTKGNNAIQPGECALSGIDGAKEYLDKLQVGYTLKIKMGIKTKSGTSPAIKEMIGGNTVLMQNGVLDPSNFSDSYNNVLYPRTGVGCSADGRYLYLMAIDGRQSHSRGVLTVEMCDLFRAIGAVDVVGFDGGGSTGMVVNKKIVNKPSDGVERAVATGWLVVNKAPEDKVISQIRFAYFPTSGLKQDAILNPVVMGYNQYDVLLDASLSDVTWSCDPELGHLSSEGAIVLDGSAMSGYIHAVRNGLKISKLITKEGFVDHIDTNHAESMKIYPTLVKDGYITVVDPIAGNKDLSIFSSKGEVVKSQIIADSFARIFIGDLSPGSYILHLRKGDQTFSQSIILSF